MAKSNAVKHAKYKKAVAASLGSTSSETDIAKRWATLFGEKSSLLERCRVYASWTLPYICPHEEETDSQQTKSNVAGGAQLVNNLANRIVDTMFPSDRAFFTLPLTTKADRALAKESKDEVDKAKRVLEIKKATLEVEKAAMRNLNLTAYRPKAIEAVKHMIIAGGCVMHRAPDGARLVYGQPDHVTVRDLKGNLIEVILRDGKKYGELDAQTKEELDRDTPNTYKDDSMVVIYTHYLLRGDVWHHVQAVDDNTIEATADQYDRVDFPCLDLSWNLVRGENNPRGLVEDHSILFHNIDVCTEAVVDLIGIAADIKFFVDPSSMLDIEELNASARGTYHTGLPDDVSSPAFTHRLELQVIREQIAEWYRMLSQAFLLNSGGIRDAERVTAEEIRAFARELESAFGGLYSKLALDWQQREAEYLIATLDFKDYKLEHFDVVVSTGLESLSREGQLDNLRLAIGDLQMLEAVPEDLRGTLDLRAFAEFVFTNRGVVLAQFVLSAEQVAKNQDAARAAEQDAVNMQSQAKVAENAAQAAANGE